MSEKSMFNQKLEQIGGGNISKGISLRGENKEKILEFINANTSQNYIINNDKLVCENSNNIKKTILDEEILQSFEEERKIIIALSENIENDVEKYISEDDIFERIIVLKKEKFIKENMTDESLADRLTKALFQYNSSIDLYSSEAIKAVIGKNSNVYHGPDSKVYASVGSIDKGEDPVYILAKSMGWYHIEYLVSSTGKHKTGYIPADVVTSYSGGTLTEEDFYGGFCYAIDELDVRTCDVFSKTAPVGTLYKNEGCTFLFSYNVGNQEIAFIEYSSSNGTKRGYVYSKYLKFPYETIVCIAKENIVVYSGPSTSHAQLGSLNQNELMSVIAKEDNMIYVEYNTIGGRKRGYVDWTKVNPRDYNSGIVFKYFYKTTQSNINQGAWVSSRQTIYGGPNTTYSEIGVVNCEDIIDYNTESNDFPLTYVEYYITGSTQKKCGYMSPTAIDNSIPMEHNTLSQLSTSYPYFGERKYYGKSQLNRDMYYYTAGTGENHLFLIFAQHGWEDGTTTDKNYYHGDGNMMVRIARNFLEAFSSKDELDENTRNEILKKWTIFVFPCNNPDGIINGSGNNGFGRCLYNKVDANRSWPGNFIARTAYETSNEKRNYVGATPLAGQESQNLKSILKNNIGTGKNVLLDMHGWENDFISRSSKLASYYVSKIKENINSNFYHKVISNSNDDRGFLIAWAYNPTTENELANFPAIKNGTINEVGLGAETALIEFPPTKNYEESYIEQKCGKQFFLGTIDLLKNYN